MSLTPQTIHDLVPDHDNANKGTERGSGLLENVLRTLGAGRSILIDEDNRVIAGNKVLQAAVDAGILRVRVIETDGNELVAVKRRGVKLDSKRGRELADADNIIPLRDIELDPAILARQAKAFDVNLDMCGMSADELAQLLAAAQPSEQDDEEPDVTQLETKPPPVMSWVLVGIPTVRYGDIAEKIEAIAKVEGTIIETTVNNQAIEPASESTEPA